MTNELHAPEIHASIDAALRRAIASRRRGWRVPAGRSSVLAVAGVMFAGTAVAATTTPWLPILGDDHRGHPSVAAGDLPGDQVAALGVLRRAQTDIDRGPSVEAVLKQLPEHDAGGVHLDDVRLLDQRPDGASVLVPMQRVGSHDPGYPSTGRADQLCVIYATGAGGSQLCGSTTDLRAGKIVGSSGGADGRRHEHGLVPDGVAKVELTLRDGSITTAEVHNNYFDAPIGKINTAGTVSSETWADDDVVVTPDKVRWLDAAGAVVPKV